MTHHAAASSSRSRLDFHLVSECEQEFFKKTCLEKLHEGDRPSSSLYEKIGRDASVKAYLVYCNTLMCGLLLYQREVDSKITVHCIKPIHSHNVHGSDVYKALLEKVFSDARAMGCGRIDAIVHQKNEAGIQFFKSQNFSFTLFPYTQQESSHQNQFLFTRSISQPAAAPSSKNTEQPLQKRPLEQPEEKAPVPKKSKEEEVSSRSQQAPPARYTPPSTVQNSAAHNQGNRSRALSFPQNSYQRRPLEVPLKEPYLSLIQQGKKTIEGRIASGLFQRVIPGSTIRFFNHTGSVTCKISHAKIYKSFDEMLRAEGIEKCLPNVRSLEEAVRIYNSLPGYRERALQHGVVAIHLQRE